MLFLDYSGRVNPARIYKISLLIFFFLISLSLFSVPLWDSDFWWHIATGRYIYENKSLPSADPFSFTSEMSENKNLYPERERFILTQYWVAQILFYLIYEKTGAAGIVLLRNLLLISCLLIILFYLRKRVDSLFLKFLSVVFPFFSVIKFTGERPVLFTIFFSVLTFVVVDLYIWKKKRLFYLLPSIMLLWANCHGGFILGDVLILLFLIGEGLSFIFKKSNLNDKEILILYGIGLLSVIASFLNPNGTAAFMITISPEYYPFTKGVQEYVPTLENINKIKIMRPDYGFLILLFLAGLVLILRNIKFNISYFFILFFLSIAGLKAMRFTVYFSLLSAIIFTIEFEKWLKEVSKSIEHLRKDVIESAGIILLLTSLSLFLFGFGKITFLPKSWSDEDVPVKGAAEFIERNQLKGNMFNSYSSGGYLAWRFYPEYKTFIDSRGLNLTVMAEYSWIIDAVKSLYNPDLPKNKKPLWERLLDHYNINFIVAEIDIFGYIPKVFFELFDRKDWVPVYVDFRSILFVRNIEEHKDVIKKYKQDSERLMNLLIARTALGAINNDYNPRYLISLGEIFTELNRLDDAIIAYKYALKRSPHNELIKKRIKELEKRKEEQR